MYLKPSSKLNIVPWEMFIINYGNENIFLKLASEVLGNMSMYLKYDLKDEHKNKIGKEMPIQGEIQ